ncbi:Predicted small secreted protein [Alteribacillus persepolensis]|uniref:Predicted small secreted protein n=1 Tax=Alteribacillus persepolensis TaxID=568899 RepID=A0A1G8KG76_9BACI|nr:PepSY domain-containing protein [Alteribacillus persepolensis]SDI42417.1 Predicted small secreted protein [Alteribacillus persepolensis]
MRVKDILVGAGIGFLAGYALKEYSNNGQISPEKALKTVKENIQDQIPVNGSWIHMTAENYQKDDLEYKVYRGGISSTKEGETKQMDFIVDAKTGTILELSS